MEQCILSLHSFVSAECLPCTHQQNDFVSDICSMSCPKLCTFADRRVAVHHSLNMPVLHFCDVCSAADCSRLDDCFYVASPDGQAGNVFFVDCDMCVAPSVVKDRNLHMQSCVSSRLSIQRGQALALTKNSFP